MSRTFRSMLRALLTRHLLKSIIAVVLALLFFGTVPGAQLGLVVSLLIAVRIGVLVAEGLRGGVRPGHWDSSAHQWQQYYRKLPEGERMVDAAALGLDLRALPEDLAQARVREALRSYVPPRGGLELLASAIGAITFLLLIPATVSFFTLDLVSLRLSTSWEAGGLLAVCAGLYWWPQQWPKSPAHVRNRIAWWVLPSLPALLLFCTGIATRHPYLNPFRSDRRQLAAERVLSSGDYVLAGRHADWVMRFARDLDRAGETRRAIHFYRAALRLDANDPEAQARLTMLETGSSDSATPVTTLERADPRAPLWTVDRPVQRAERRAIGPELQGVAGVTAVVVPVGDVSDQMLDAVAHAIRHELDLPVFVASDRVPLPAHTRMRGVFTGPQWDATAMARALHSTGITFPHAPIRYVLVTSADLYEGNANFIFSATCEWGAFVSSARLGGEAQSDQAYCHRVAKQSVCALIKCFGVQASRSRDCVTSYARSLEEFDSKGNRPNAESMAVFQRTLAAMNDTWIRVSKR